MPSSLGHRSAIEISIPNSPEDTHAIPPQRTPSVSNKAHRSSTTANRVIQHGYVGFKGRTKHNSEVSEQGQQLCRALVDPEPPTTTRAEAKSHIQERAVSKG